MRFADAVATLGGLGIQVHRCYWVAHRHVIGTLGRDDRMLVRVTGRHELPVSRTHLANVRAAVSTRKPLSQPKLSKGDDPASDDEEECGSGNSR